MINKPKIGDIIPFGEYNWRVLDVKGDKALIITEDVVEQRRYHEQYIDVTWETCDLRKYLNGEFLDKFDSARIVQVTNQNPDSPYDGKDGNPTQDKIFLLNLDEFLKYFGDNGYFDITIDYETDAWWWLRTLGSDNHRVVTVHEGNSVYSYNRADYCDGGVSPALWLKLDGGNENE